MEWLTTSQQVRLINEEPLFAEMPTLTIRGIVRWLRSRGGTRGEVAVPTETTSATFAHGNGRVVDRLVALGDDELFGS